MKTDKFIKLVMKFGLNPQSFFGAYSGFKYEEIDDFMIAYVDTIWGRVVAGPPVGPNEVTSDIFKKFTDQCKLKSKKIFFIALNETEKTQASKSGLRAIPVGKDPYFELQIKNLNFKKFPETRHLISLGATVNEVKTHLLSSNELKNIEQFKYRWLSTRKMPALSFLNEVNLKDSLEYKKIFKAVLGKKTLGYLLAVPAVKADNWYLVDVLRDPLGEQGVAALLIIEAMKILKLQNVKTVSLGMAPLINISWQESGRNLELIRKYCVELGGKFYRFKSLREYKEKLGPSRWETNFIVSNGSLLRTVLALKSAFFPRGLIYSYLFFVIHKFKFLPQSDWLDSIERDTIFLKPAKKTWSGLFTQVRGSTFLGIAIIVTFLIFDFLAPDLESKKIFAFDLSQPWVNYSVRAWYSWILHWDFTHLLVNILLLLPLGMLAEILFGTPFSTVVFLLGTLLTQLVSPFLLYTVPIYLNLPNNWLSPFDLGSSLGLFSMVGALCYSTRLRWVGFTLCGMICATLFYFTHDIVQFNHLIAFILGVSIAWLRFTLYPKFKWLKYPLYGFS